MQVWATVMTSFQKKWNILHEEWRREDLQTDYFYLEMTEMYLNVKRRAGGVAVNIRTGLFPNTQTFWLERICCEFWKALTFCVQVSKLANYTILGYHSKELSSVIKNCL
jgi:hypothetical protein